MELIRLNDDSRSAVQQHGALKSYKGVVALFNTRCQKDEKEYKEWKKRKKKKKDEEQKKKKKKKKKKKEKKEKKTYIY